MTDSSFYYQPIWVIPFMAQGTLDIPHGLCDIVARKKKEPLREWSIDDFKKRL